jgi:hypothetical protein
MAMADIYHQDKPEIESYLEHFRVVPSQVGAVFLINGKLVGMDCVDKSVTFEKLFKKLVESYALDAVDWFDPKAELKAPRSDVDAFLKVIADSRTENHKSVGLGIDLRLDSPGCVGFALAYGEILHLSVFARDKKSGDYRTGARMQRFSNRRSRQRH